MYLAIHTLRTLHRTVKRCSALCAGVKETVEIARDVAKKLIEAQTGPNTVPLPPAREVFDYPLIVAT